jgi:Motility quorum-sensing regulator, toxin of MqsA
MQPTYPLYEVKRLVSEGRYVITVTALATAALMGFDDESIVECIVQELAGSHFYKTMAAASAPGLMQDVYKISYEGRRVYLKLQINRSKNAVVISFKEDESASD